MNSADDKTDENYMDIKMLSAAVFTQHALHKKKACICIDMG